MYIYMCVLIRNININYEIVFRIIYLFIYYKLNSIYT